MAQSGKTLHELGAIRVTDRITTVNGFLSPMYPTAAPQSLVTTGSSSNDIINITSFQTELSTDAPRSITLADGTKAGHT